MTAKNIGKKVIKAPIAIRKFTPAKHFANAKIASEHNKKVEQKLADLKKEVERLRPGENLVPRDYPFPYNKHFEEIYSTKSWDDSYPFNKENVEEFINFARHSGGFAIC